MATLSRLITPQRAKTNAKHAQNAAYNQAQIAAQSGQPIAAMPQGMQSFSKQQQQKLMGQQAGYAAQNVAAPISSAMPVMDENRGQVSTGQFEQGQVAAGQPIGQAMPQQTSPWQNVQQPQHPVTPAPSAPWANVQQPNTGNYGGHWENQQGVRQNGIDPGFSVGNRYINDAPSANHGGQYRQSPGVYGKRPPPAQTSSLTPSWIKGTGLQNASWMRKG